MRPEEKERKIHLKRTLNTRGNHGIGEGPYAHAARSTGKFQKSLYVQKRRWQCSCKQKEADIHSRLHGNLTSCAKCMFLDS